MMPEAPGWAAGTGSSTHLLLLWHWEKHPLPKHGFPQELPPLTPLNWEQGSSFSMLHLCNVFLSRGNTKNFVS